MGGDARLAHGMTTPDGIWPSGVFVMHGCCTPRRRVPTFTVIATRRMGGVFWQEPRALPARGYWNRRFLGGEEVTICNLLVNQGFFEGRDD